MPKEETKNITGIYEEFLKVSVDKLKFEKNDVIILRGNWDEDSVHNMLKIFDERKLDNIVLILPEGKDIETIGIRQFYDILKEVEKKCIGDNNVLDNSDPVSVD